MLLFLNPSEDPDLNHNLTDPEHCRIGASGKGTTWLYHLTEKNSSCIGKIGVC
jgi:hypothetical protein